MGWALQTVGIPRPLGALHALDLSIFQVKCKKVEPFLHYDTVVRQLVIILDCSVGSLGESPRNSRRPSMRSFPTTTFDACPSCPPGSTDSQLALLERFFAAATRTAGLAGERIKSMPVLNWLEMGLGVSCLAHIVWQMSLNQSLLDFASAVTGQRSVLETATLEHEDSNRWDFADFRDAEWEVVDLDQPHKEKEISTDVVIVEQNVTSSNLLLGHNGTASPSLGTIDQKEVCRVPDVTPDADLVRNTLTERTESAEGLSARGRGGLLETTEAFEEFVALPCDLLDLQF